MVDYTSAVEAVVPGADTYPGVIEWTEKYPYWQGVVTLKIPADHPGPDKDQHVRLRIEAFGEHVASIKQRHARSKSGTIRYYFRGYKFPAVEGVTMRDHIIDAVIGTGVAILVLGPGLLIHLMR